jgi:hypothetical protein
MIVYRRDYDYLERRIYEGYYVIIIFILCRTWEVQNIQYTLPTRYSLYQVVSMSYHKVTNFCISLKLLAYRQDFAHYFRFQHPRQFRYYEYEGLPLQQSPRSMLILWPSFPANCFYLNPLQA